MIDKHYDAQSLAIIDTASGSRLDLCAPSPSCILLTDIAHHLARTNLYNGACCSAYSAAQQACLLHDRLRSDMRVYGLLWDSYIAYLGVVPEAAQKALKQQGGGALEALVALRGAISSAIFEAASIQWPPKKEVLFAIRKTKQRALATERRDLFPSKRGREKLRGKPWPQIIKPLSGPEAEIAFLERLSLYQPNIRECEAQRRGAIERQATLQA